MTYTTAETLKFALLSEGLTVDAAALAHIDNVNDNRALTSADYASTSGLILALENDVWVNAPTVKHNPNFLTEPAHRLTFVDDGLVVTGPLGEVRAGFWLQPAWHGTTDAAGVPLNSLGYTHADRVRVSPIEGCAFTCTFCDLPYEFRYRTKSVEQLVALVRTALNDPVQPAHHVLISGGTPRPEDYGYVAEAYEAIITEFPGVPVDIMMVPLHEVLDVAKLAALGLEEVSINLEVWSDEVARKVMPRKHKQGRDHYLDYLTVSARELGGEHVRSMLMLGLEPLESTLEGVEAIAERGCVPVLSPFRPDPSTPLRATPVPTARFLEETYSRAYEITQRHGVPLGPLCIPCAHNTLSLPRGSGHGDATRYYGVPRLG